MLIKFTCKEGTVKIQDHETLLDYLKSGELKSDTIIYDGVSGKYEKLVDVAEIKELALIPEYNQYLNINTKILNEEKRKKEITKSSSNVATSISLVLLLLGISKKIISYLFMSSVVSSGSGNSYVMGQILGSLIGRSLIGIFIWYVIWKWSQNNGKKYFLVVYSTIFLLFS